MELTNDLIVELLKKSYKAASNSIDPSTQVGAIILSNTNIVSSWNNILGRQEIDINDRDQKMLYVEHAERGCITKCAKRGIITNNSIMACNFAICFDCAKEILAAGVKTLIHHTDVNKITPDRWTDSINMAFNYLKSNGMSIISYSGPINAEPLRFNGMQWDPNNLSLT